MEETSPDQTNSAAAENNPVDKAAGAENEPVEAETDQVSNKDAPEAVNTEDPADENEEEEDSYSNFKWSDPISIDESDSDVDPAPTQFMLSNGLPYSDHNYDVYDISKRYKKDPEEDKKFPIMEKGISDSPEPPEGGISAPTRPAAAPRSESVGPLQPLGRQSNEGMMQPQQQGTQGARSGVSFQPMRADMIDVYDPVYGQSRTAPPQQNAPITPSGRRLVPARIPPPQSSTYIAPPKPTSQRFTTVSQHQAATMQQHDYLEEDTGTPPTLQPAAPRNDQPLHRMAEAPSGNQPDDAPHRVAQRSAQFNAADPSKAAYAHAPAPMFVLGRGTKPVMRGRTGSQPSRSGKEDQPEATGAVNQEGVPVQPAPSPNKPGATPGKKVHFSDGVPVPPSTVEAAPPSVASPVKYSLKAPVPPHRMAATNFAIANTPPRMPLRRPPPLPSQSASVPPRPVQSVPDTVDPHKMPENIMDDSPAPPATQSPQKPLRDASLPPEVAAMALQFAPKSSAASCDQDFSEDLVKAKIAEISREIADEVRQEEIAASRRASGNEVAGGRGRGRPKNSTGGRVRSSLSGSSGVGDVNTRDMGSPGGGLTTNRMPPRPPGSSPVRTNIDYALPSMPLPSVRNGPGRTVYPIPPPTRNGAPPTAPARGGHAREELQPAKGRRGRKPKAALAPKVVEPASESDDEEEEQDWVTRCICGMTHSDEFMVACDRCDVWQHGICFGLKKNDVGDDEEYLCEECDPGRKLKYTKEQARDIQRRQLEKVKRASSGRGRKGKKQQVVTTTTTTTKKAAGRPARSLSTASSKKFEEISHNVYSKRAKRLIDVARPSHNSQFTLPVHPQVKALFVASGIQGLVTTAPVAEGSVMMELVGRVCLPDECGRELPANQLPSHPYQPFCVLYDGFADPKATPTMQQESYLCIDSRKHGNDSRMVRRCCRPNCVVRHVIENGEVHFLIVAKENLPQTTEISIPFDLDQAVTRDNCVCRETTDASDCLIYLNAPFEKGHRPEPEELDETADASPTSPEVVPEKREKRGRPKKDSTINIPPTANRYLLKPPSLPSRVLKEEKSEEEIVAKKDEPVPEVIPPESSDDLPATSSGRRPRRSSATVPPAPPKKGSEKEEPSKAESSRSRRSSHSQKSPKKEEEPVIYTLSSEKGKPDREERKMQAALALIEKNTKKEPKKEKEHATSAKKESSSAKGRSKTVQPKEVKEEKPEPERRQLRKKKEPEPEPVQSSPSVQPPKKRWSAAAVKEEEKPEVPAKKAHVEEEPSNPSPSLAGKKQWMRRHAAESISEEKKSDEKGRGKREEKKEEEEKMKKEDEEDVRRRMASPPLKKRRDMREAGQSSSDEQKRAEAANVLAGLGTVRERTDSPELLQKLNTAVDELKVNLQKGTDFVLPTLSPTGLKLPTSDAAKPADEVPEVVEQPRKVGGKRLSLEDYKKRRSAGGGTVDSSTVLSNSPKRERVGFIPSMHNIQSDSSSLLPIHLPPDSLSPSNLSSSASLTSPVNVPLDQLKREIYGGGATSSQSKPRSPSTRSSTVAQQQPSPVVAPQLQSPRGGDVSTDEESAAHNMSVADRLKHLFGNGVGSPPRAEPVSSAAPVGQSSNIPPVGHLATCPPPVTRRGSAGYDPRPPASSTTQRRSRWGQQ